MTLNIQKKMLSINFKISQKNEGAQPVLLEKVVNMEKLGAYEIYSKARVIQKLIRKLKLLI